MIKKLFLCAALVGAVGLTSCVDDVETASVQAIRGAKAEQFKANADLQNAQAEAAIVLANANKATEESAAAALQAQADYKKALAEKKNAEAAYKNALAAAKNAKTESDKAAAAVELEKQKAILAQNQQLLEKLKLEVEGKKGELASLIAQYEKEIAASNLTIEGFKQKLEALVYEKADAEYDMLKKLVGNYTLAAKTLKGYQDALFSANADLAKFQAGLTSKVEATNKLIAQKTERREALNAKIIEKEAYIATITTTEYANAKDELKSLTEERVELNQLQANAEKTSSSASAAYNAAANILNGSDYVKAVQKLMQGATTFTQSSYYYGDDNYSQPCDSIPYLVIDQQYGSVDQIDPALYGNLYVTIRQEDADGNLIENKYPISWYPKSEKKYVKAVYTDEKWVNVSYTDGGGNPQNYQYKDGLVDDVMTEEYYVYDPNDYYAFDQNTADTLTKVISDNIDQLNTIVKNCATTIKNTNDQIGTLKDLKAECDKADKAVTDLKAPAADAAQDVIDKYNADKKTVDDAKKAADDALVVELKKVDENYTAVSDYNAAVNNLKSIVKNTTEASNQIENVALPYAQKYAETLEGYFATIKKEGNVSSLVDDYNKASLANAQAALDEKVAKGNVLINQSKQDACTYIINTSTTADNQSISTEIDSANTQINTWKDKIKTIDAKIVSLKESLVKNQITDEKLISEYQAQIATLEEEIFYQQKLVDAAKAALDAALAAE